MSEKKLISRQLLNCDKQQLHAGFDFIISKRQVLYNIEAEGRESMNGQMVFDAAMTSQRRL